MTLVIYAFACFSKVFLAIFQAKNVQYTHYLSAFLTSLLITGADIFYIRLAVAGDLLLALVVGAISNAVAVVGAMKFYAVIRGEKQ